jgi:hypothetical protein
MGCSVRRRIDNFTIENKEAGNSSIYEFLFGRLLLLRQSQASGLAFVFCDRLVLEGYRRPADAQHLEGYGYLYTVGDLDEGNAAIHPVVLAVEGHSPLNF